MLLANWVVTGDQPWDERVAGWVDGRGCDAWFWQREVADPGEYAALWLRDAGERPGTDRWTRRYDAWLDWFAASGIVAVGMGLVALFRPCDATAPVTVVAEDVPQAVVQPVGAELPAWAARQRWLARTDDAGLLAARLQAASGTVLTRDDLPDGDGATWRTAALRLRQASGLCWEVEVDEHIAAVVAACDGTRPLAAAARRPGGRPRPAGGRGRRRRAAGGARPRRPGVPAAGRRGGRLMRAVVQRVSRAEVRVGGETVGAIGRGLLVLVGVTHDDTVEQARTLARKVHGLRVLDGETSVAERPDAGVLVVSQFTLYGDARKGRRPTWAAAAPGPVAEPLVDAVVEALRAAGAHVETGVFGADMAVELVNDGPMTVLLDV